MMAAMAGVIFGYDIGNSGGVTSMEPFLKKFFPEVDNKMRRNTKSSNYCKFDSQLLTSFTSSLYLAGFVSSFFASSITQTYGRRFSILIGGASFFAGGVIGGAALNVYMVIIGRIMLGGLGSVLAIRQFPYIFLKWHFPSIEKQSTMASNSASALERYLLI